MALALSGPLYSGDEQPAMPAVVSPPAIVAVSGWLYQPLVSAPRLAAAVAVGGVASYLKGRLVVADVAGVVGAEAHDRYSDAVGAAVVRGRRAAR